MTRGKKNYATENLVWGVILLVGAYWYFGWGDDPSPAEKAAATAAIERKEAECTADLDCWASKWQVRAGRDCQEQIQRLAKNNFEWTDGWSEPKLARALWLDQGQKTVTYVAVMRYSPSARPVRHMAPVFRFRRTQRDETRDTAQRYSEIAARNTGSHAGICACCEHPQRRAIEADRFERWRMTAA